ncbi:MAG: hypothetical protein GX612_08125 [Bacteroidales bacterium]|nr:hypothetical protein [Bacteroidales bacterium]
MKKITNKALIVFVVLCVIIVMISSIIILKKAKNKTLSEWIQYHVILSDSLSSSYDSSVYKVNQEDLCIDDAVEAI